MTPSAARLPPLVLLQCVKQLPCPALQLLRDAAASTSTGDLQGVIYLTRNLTARPLLEGLTVVRTCVRARVPACDGVRGVGGVMWRHVPSTRSSDVLGSMSVGTRVCTAFALMGTYQLFVCLFVCLKRQRNEYTAAQFGVRVTQFHSPIRGCKEGTASLFDTGILLHGQWRVRALVCACH